MQDSLLAVTGETTGTAQTVSWLRNAAAWTRSVSEVLLPCLLHHASFRRGSSCLKRWAQMKASRSCRLSNSSGSFCIGWRHPWRIGYWSKGLSVRQITQRSCQSSSRNSRRYGEIVSKYSLLFSASRVIDSRERGLNHGKAKDTKDHPSGKTYRRDHSHTHPRCGLLPCFDRKRDNDALAVRTDQQV